MQPVFSISETAAYFRSSRGHVYNLLRRGELLSVKVGGRTLIRLVDIDALIDRSTAPFQENVSKARKAKRPANTPTDAGIFG